MQNLAMKKTLVLFFILMLTHFYCFGQRTGDFYIEYTEAVITTNNTTVAYYPFINYDYCTNSNNIHININNKRINTFDVGLCSFYASTTKDQVLSSVTIYNDTIENYTIIPYGQTKGVKLLIKAPPYIYPSVSNYIGDKLVYSIANKKDVFNLYLDDTKSSVTSVNLTNEISLKNYIPISGLFTSSHEIKMSHILGEDVDPSCVDEELFSSSVQKKLYDFPEISVSSTSSNVVCQDQSITITGNYKNYTDISSYSSITYISDLQYKVKGGGWTTISKKLNKSISLTYKDIFNTNTNYYGQEIQIRPFRMFGTDSIIGNTVSVAFLPIANITLVNKPIIKCNGGSIDNLIFKCDALPKDGADAIGGVKPKLLFTIYRYTKRPLTENDPTYKKYLYKDPKTGMIDTFYYLNGATYQIDEKEADGDSIVLTKAMMNGFNLGAGLYRIAAKFNSTTAYCSNDTVPFLVEEPKVFSSNVITEVIKSTRYHIATGADSCNMKLTFTGGTKPYYYKIDNNKEFQCYSADTTILFKQQKDTINKHIISRHDAYSCKVFNDTVFLLRPKDLKDSLVSINVSCNSKNNGTHDNGTIKCFIKNGCAPYNIYLDSLSIRIDSLINYKSTDANPAKFENLSKGYYKVYIKDATGGSLMDSVQVKEPDSLNLIITPHSPKCKGQSTGSLLFTPSGGTGTGYSYIVTLNNDTIKNHSGLQAGFYKIKLFDANTCSRKDSIQLNDPAQLGIQMLDTVPASCSAAQNGKIQLKVLNYQGKPSNIKFQNTVTKVYLEKENKKDTITIKKLSNQIYNIQAIDDSLCTVDTIITIPLRSPGLSLSSSTTIPAPCSGKGGEVTLTARNGEGKYTFTVDGHGAVPQVDTTKVFSLKSGKAHTLSVSDGICSVTIPNANVEIISNPIQLETIKATDITPSHCASSATGAITVSRKTGTGGGVYKNTTYSISPSTGIASGGTFSNLYTGHYTITAEDDSSCVAIDTVDVPVSANVLKITSENIQKAACEGESPTGTLTVKNNGTGFGIIRFSVDTVITATHGFPGTEFLFKNLYSGNHTLYAQDGSGCAAQIIGNVEFNSNPVSLYANIKHQTCNETSDASITLSAKSTTKGTAQLFKFEYAGKKTGWLTDTTYTVKKAGNYLFTVTDQNNCGTSKDTVVVNLKKKPLLMRSRYDSLACLEIKKPNGGLWLKVDSINASVAPYTYYLNKIEKKGKNASTLIHYNNLDNSIHRVIVVDGLGCKDSSDYSIPITLNKVHITRIDTINASCVAAQNGKATIKALSYLPSDYKYVCDNDTLKGRSVTFTNLPVKNNSSYVVKVIDDFGCEHDSTFVIRTRQDTLNLSFSSLINAACPGSSDGQIKLERIRGKADYNFLVKANNDTVQQFTNNNKEVVINGLPANTYSVVVLDKDHCRAELSEKVVIGEPDTIRFLNNSWNYIKQKGATDGLVKTQIWKGNNKYNYSWRHLPDSVILKEGKITNADKLTFEKLKAGNYLLQVQDTAKCWVNTRGWLEKEYNIIEPDTALSLTLVSSKAVSCNGLSDGQFKVKAIGGWHKGNNYLYGLNINSLTTTPTFSNLKTGTVNVTVKDTAGVTATLPVTITQPEVLTASLQSVTDANCYGSSDGVINLTISGGNNPYYKVSTDSIKWVNGSILKQLKKGTYTAYVRDTLNCATQLKKITIGEPSDIVVSSFLVKESRCGYNNGSITTTISGGVPNYNYSWSSTDYSIRDANKCCIDSLMSGAYKLDVTDNHNCHRSFAYNVSDSTNLTIDALNTSNVSCWGYKDGGASIKLSKGNPPYVVTWPDNTHQMEVGSLAAGTYNVRIDDKEKCKLFKDFDIGTPDRIGIESYTLRDPYCEGVPDGSITVAAIGSFGNYNYAWSNGQTGATAKGLSPGVYNVKVTDSHTCFNQFEYSLKYQQTIHPSLGRDLALCAGNTALVTTITPYKGYKWTSDNNFSATDAQVTLENAGHYYVEVTDFDDCIGRDTLSITQSTTPLTGKLLVASQVQQMDTVMIFETSWPIPDSVKFDLPGASLLAFGTYYREVVYADTGTYKVGLTAYLHDCFDYVGSTITVVPRQANGTLKSGKSSIFSQIKVYPNPSTGPVNVELMLSKKADVTVKLANLGTGVIINEQQLKGFDHYSIKYDLNLPSGSYLLYFQSGNESKTKTIIIR
jgi:hypothetical protein